MKLKKNGEPKLSGWPKGKKRKHYKALRDELINLCLSLIHKYEKDDIDTMRILLSKIEELK